MRFCKRQLVQKLAQIDYFALRLHEKAALLLIEDALTQSSQKKLFLNFK